MSSLLVIGLTNALLSAVLGIAAFAVTRMCKNPHVAHALWLVVLLKLITPPLINIPLPDLAFSDGVKAASFIEPQFSGPELQSIAAGLPDSDLAAHPAGPPDSARLRASHDKNSQELVIPAIGSVTPAPRSDGWQAWVGMIWVIGSILCCLITCARIAGFHRQVKGTRIAGKPIQQIGEAVAKQLGIRRRPQLRIVDAQLSPMVWPIGHPQTVLLPQRLVDELEPDQLRTILAHEFAHIARGDSWVRWLEVSCTVLYWWNPCLWLARKELRAAEELCTDALVVSSNPSCSRALGESLLKANEFLSGITSGCPILVSEMRGSGQLRRRIEMIVNGRVPPRLSRATRCAMLIVAVAILPLSAQEAQSVQEAEEQTVPVTEVADTPTIAEVIKGLKAREEATESLVVTCRIESSNNFTKPGTKPTAEFPIEDEAVSMTRTGEITWELTRDGRGRMAAKLAKTNIRFDGSKKSKLEEFVSTFDGKKGQFLSMVKTPKGATIQRQQRATSTFMKVAGSPYDFTTQHLGKPISSLLSVENSKIVGSEEWEQRPVIVVEAAPVTVRDDYIYKQQFWIDVNRGFTVVRRQSYVQRGEGKPWGLHYEVDASTHDEVLPQFWLPKVVDVENYHVAQTGQDYQVSQDHIETSKWMVNESIDSSRFELPQESIDSIGQPIDATSQPAASNGKQPSSDDAAGKQNTAPGFREMLIKTVGEKGSPVSDVRIYVNIWPDGPYKVSKRNYQSDEQGRVSVLVPSPPRLFRMWTQKKGFVPLFAQWWPEHQSDGSQIPEEFTFSLPKGTEIGGAIVDDDAAPIKGAVVEVALGNRVDEMARRPVPSMWLSEVPGPGNNPCITDANGHWSLDNVPAGNEIFVRVKVTHPDYISDTHWGGLQEEQAITMTALRDKSATIAMHRGVVLTGRVTGAEGEPIPDAVVVRGDDPYLEEGTQEVRTDQGGAYRLKPLSPGKVNVTVVAEGWSPASRTVDIKGSAPTQDFQLKTGNPLRIHFVDEHGKSIPNVSVSIRAWRGSKALYNHRHPNVLNTDIPTRSDDEGIFAWEWAPHDDVDFAFYKDGYRSLDRTLSADRAVHTVRMVPQAVE